jgi:hypothetical protein
MEKSTILVVGTLGLIGAGAYFYLKGKKTTTPISSSTTSTTTTTTSSSAVDSSLGLPAITTVTNVIDETKTNNYIMAKKISEEIAGLQERIKSLSSDFFKKYPKFDTSRINLVNMGINMEKDRLYKEQVEFPMALMTRNMQTKTPQANALGYKILPYGLIEKM